MRNEPRLKKRPESAGQPRAEQNREPCSTLSTTLSKIHLLNVHRSSRVCIEECITSISSSLFGFYKAWKWILNNRSKSKTPSPLDTCSRSSSLVELKVQMYHWGSTVPLIYEKPFKIHSIIYLLPVYYSPTSILFSSLDSRILSLYIIARHFAFITGFHVRRGWCPAFMVIWPIHLSRVGKTHVHNGDAANAAKATDISSHLLIAICSTERYWNGS